MGNTGTESAAKGVARMYSNLDCARSKIKVILAGARRAEGKVDYTIFPGNLPTELAWIAGFRSLLQHLFVMVRLTVL